MGNSLVSFSTAFSPTNLLATSQPPSGRSCSSPLLSGLVVVDLASLLHDLSVLSQALPMPVLGLPSYAKSGLLPLVPLFWNMPGAKHKQIMFNHKKINVDN